MRAGDRGPRITFGNFSRPVAEVPPGDPATTSKTTHRTRAHDANRECPRAKQLRGKPAAGATPEGKSTAGFLKVNPAPLKGPAGTACGAAAQTGSVPPPPAPRRLPPKSDRHRATRAAACPAAGCSAAGIDPGVACRIQGFRAPRPQAPAKSIATGWVAPNPGYAKTNIRMFDASAGTRSSCRRSMPRFNARTASLSQCSPRLAFWRLE